MNELSPLLRELSSHPVAFLGGFFSGVFRLDLNEDPVKGWLGKQNVNGPVQPPSTEPGTNGSGPQSISID
ncbi:MAG: hypothetical protein AAF289_12795 [Cyanobacteria bacterium P01_A01_bin.135]